MTVATLLILFISSIISGCSDNKTNQTDNEGVISDEDGYVPLCGNGFLDETSFEILNQQNVHSLNLKNTEQGSNMS
jgi:hypothetical protein